jgi:hypothetical protein
MQRKPDKFDCMKYALLFVFLSGGLSACLNVTTFPDEPSLSFVSLSTYPDSAVLRLNFTDGNGDFGIENEEVEDTSSTFNDCPNGFNLRLEYYERRNGVWVNVPRNPCAGEVGFYYTVPWVQPTGQNKTQQGEIKVLLSPAYYLLSAFDTCRFEARIYDRAFNASANVVTTTFVKP